MFFINKAVKGRNKILNMFLEGSTVIKQEYLGKLSSSLEKKIGVTRSKIWRIRGFETSIMFFFFSLLDTIAYIIA
jgi:hypothetical protein